MCAAAMGMFKSAVIAWPQRQPTGGNMLASTSEGAGALHLLAATHSHHADVCSYNGHAHIAETYAVIAGQQCPMTAD